MTKPDDKHQPAAPALSRRGWFRKLATLGAGGAVAAAAATTGCKRGWNDPADDITGRALDKPYVPGEQDYGQHEERWFNTSCGQCSAGCGIRVRVVEGRAVRVEGNPNNPVNRGGIGARGLSSLQALYDPDRIQGPLQRIDGSLVRVSWKRALETLGNWLTEVRHKGPDKLLVMTGLERGMTHELFDRFCRAYGTPNFVDGRPGHSGALAQAMETSLGSHESPAYGWAGAKTVLSLEAALVEDSCQSVYFARVAAEARRSGRGARAKIIHAGPMFDLAAYNSDSWLRVQPGTSGVLALGICHLLIANHDAGNDLDREHFINTDAFRTFVKRFSVDRVGKLTGMRPRDVAALADELWANRPAFALVDERSVGYTNGVHTASAAYALNALLGAIEAPVGGMRLSPAPGYRPWPKVELDAAARMGASQPRLDGAGSKRYPHARSVHGTLPDAIAANPPSVALLHYTDPVYARAQPDSWAKALAQIPMVVSFSPYMDDTVSKLAHLVLPDHTPLERWEDAGIAPGIARAVAGVRRPVVEPLMNTRAAADVLLETAKTIGGSVATALPWPTFRAALDDRWSGLHKLQRGTIVAQSERSFMRNLHQQAVWAEQTDAAVQPVTFRFQPTYELPRWHGDNERYPFKLIAYRSLGHAVGGGANQPWLRMLRERPGMKPWDHLVFVNPKDVAGIDSGDKVTINSQGGAVTLTAHHDRRMTRGCLAISMGRGHQGMGRWAQDDGVNVMRLLHPGPAPQSGTNVLCGTRVRIDKGAA